MNHHSLILSNFALSIYDAFVNNLPIYVVSNDIKLLVCKWRHGGHVGGQEQKHFSSLINELYFDANLAEKFQVKWLRTKNTRAFIGQEDAMAFFAVIWSRKNSKDSLILINSKARLTARS